MSKQGASSEERAGADVGSAPVEEPEVVEAEVVEGEGDAPVVDAEVVEDGESPEAAGTAAEVDADLDAMLADTKRERDEYLELARRARADFENYRRRVSGETAAAELRGKTTLARGLLPALDNLERALTAAGIDPGEGPDPGGEPPSEEVSARDALAAGVALVYRELRDGLARSGVHGFDPVGERFDPSLHEAIATGEADGAEPGIVLETLEQGYRVDDQVIRPARVVVSG